MTRADEDVAASADESPTRSGFIAVVGRPNVGKSTLVNAIVGEKVAIVSDRPQTTRRGVRGVVTRGREQLVLVDLPGMQRPRDTMTGRMRSIVADSVAECDGALFLLNGDQRIGAGDRFLAELLVSAGTPVVTALNKIDRLSRARTLDALEQAAALAPGELYPISARTGEGVEPLLAELLGMLSPGPFYYPVDDHTDLPQADRLAELVREQVILRVREEIPHAVAVRVDEIETRERPDGVVKVISAELWVESDSQRVILIGKGGRMIRSIGAAARPEIERLLGCRVHLDLSVQVRKRWRRDESLLDRLGIR